MFRLTSAAQATLVLIGCLFAAPSARADCPETFAPVLAAVKADASQKDLLKEIGGLRVEDFIAAQGGPAAADKMLAGRIAKLKKAGANARTAAAVDIYTRMRRAVKECGASAKVPAEIAAKLPADVAAKLKKLTPQSGGKPVSVTVDYVTYNVDVKTYRRRGEDGPPTTTESRHTPLGGGYWRTDWTTRVRQRDGSTREETGFGYTALGGLLPLYMEFLTPLTGVHVLKDFSVDIKDMRAFPQGDEFSLTLGYITHSSENGAELETRKVCQLESTVTSERMTGAPGSVRRVACDALGETSTFPEIWLHFSDYEILLSGAHPQQVGRFLVRSFDIRPMPGR